MKQENFKINNWLVMPILQSEDDKKYYPVKYIMEKVLLKQGITFIKQDKYRDNVIRLKVDWSFAGTSPQECYCINSDGLIKYLNSCKINRLSEEQLIRHNFICDLVGCNKKVDIEAKFEKEIYYDDYIKYSMLEYSKINSHYEIRKCICCGREMPLVKEYFLWDKRLLKTNKGFHNKCRECSSSKHTGIWHPDELASKIYYKFGLEKYNEYMSDKILFIMNNKDGNMKYSANSEEELYDIVSQLCKRKYGYLRTLSIEHIKCFKIKYIKSVSLNKLIEVYSNDDCKIRPWKYKNYMFDSLTEEEVIKMYDSYLKEKNIVIDDITGFDKYDSTLRDCRAFGFIRKDNYSSLQFIVKYYNYKYGGYKFKLKSSNYYDIKENRIFDMKCLIENDLKIDILKIPLYITKYILHRDYKALSHVLKKYYNNNLYNWINECYPDKFIELDFNINPYRSEFDSLEESQVDDIIRSKFNNLIYNCRTNTNYISINGMLPDWVLFTDKACYLIEYFGLYAEKVDTSHRLQRYKEKTDIKIDKYNNLEGYKHMFIYPYDLKNDFEGLRNKLNKIA